MTRPVVFIASSTEGLPEAHAVQAGLQQALGSAADIRLWTTEFGLSSTYIEALESVAAEADFAIGVISGDDRVVSRATGRATGLATGRTTRRARAQRAPRDNVSFELGLFIGALGRPRCFMVHRKGQDLKLPSDLLAVVSADYQLREDQTLMQALQPRCAQIAKRVMDLGTLRRISPAALVRRAQSLALATLLAGDGWERIRGPDETTESLKLRGQAYDRTGQTAAHWRGQVVELHADTRRLVYRWSGTHPDAPQTQFHGIGELEFEAPSNSPPGQPAQRGWGRFWDVDESRPENTQSKAVELRRETDARVVARMRDGRASEPAALSVRIHSDW